MYEIAYFLIFALTLFVVVAVTMLTIAFERAFERIRYMLFIKSIIQKIESGINRN
jgi:hypothetical protein